MPLSQSSRVLAASLGSDWRSRLADFSAKPVAAASIGQVHQGILPDGSRVAIKVQFPGISKSIQSDLGNLKMLLAASALLPRGLYLDNTIKVMQRELLDECDYQREADCGRKFGQLLRDDPNFTVPEVIQDLTAGQVLTAQWMEGVALGKVQNQTQEWRDQVRRLSSVANVGHVERGALTKGLCVTGRDKHFTASTQRVVRVPTHADGSQLEQLPLE